MQAKSHSNYRVNKKSRIIEVDSTILIDLSAVILSFLSATAIRFGTLDQNKIPETQYMVCFCLLLLSILYSVFTEWNHGIFNRGLLVELVAIIKYNVVMITIMGCVIFIFQWGYTFSRLVWGFFLIFNIVFTYIFHLIFKQFMLNSYRKSSNSDKVMIVTEEVEAENLLTQMLNDQSWDYEITSVALIEKSACKDICDIPVVADLSTLFDVARKIPLDAVFLHLPNTDVKKIRSIIEDFESMGIVCHYDVEIDDLSIEGKTPGTFAGHAVLTYSLQYWDYRRVMLKRMIDILGSIAGIFVTLMFLPFVGIAIKVESAGPIFFSQIRIGKNGRRFRLWKFRSMYVDAEAQKKDLQNEVTGPFFKVDRDPRITKVGRFIRKFSIDELPQFVNVLKGDMSLVGTRPPTEEEFEQYNNHYRRRLSITPGVTGLWQVEGRSLIDNFEEVVKFDIEYIENWSLELDVKIMLKTIGVVLTGRGAK